MWHLLLFLIATATVVEADFCPILEEFVDFSLPATLAKTECGDKGKYSVEIALTANQSFSMYMVSFNALKDFLRDKHNTHHYELMSREAVHNVSIHTTMAVDRPFCLVLFCDRDTECTLNGYWAVIDLVSWYYMRYLKLAISILMAIVVCKCLRCSDYLAIQTSHVALVIMLLAFVIATCFEPHTTCSRADF